MRLQRLTGLEREKIVEEYHELMVLIARLREILASRPAGPERSSARADAQIKEQYGDKRRTEIIPEPRDISIEDMIADEDMVITVSRGGYIKRSPLIALPRAAPRRQGPHRHADEGRGHRRASLRRHRRTATSWSSPRAGGCTGSRCTRSRRPGRRRAARRSSTCCELEPGENGSRDRDGARVPGGPLSSSSPREKGTVKKTELTAFSNPRAAASSRIDINEGDRLLAVRVTDGKKDIFLATAKGFAIRFPESDVRPMGRATYGVSGIRLREGDHVVGMEAARTATATILTVTERGFGKRTADRRVPPAEPRRPGHHQPQGRAKTGEVIGARHVPRATA